MASSTTTRPVGAVTRTETVLFSPFETPGLISRLLSELLLAASELKQDPRGFGRGIFYPDEAVKNVKRRRLIVTGLCIALVVYGLAAVVIVKIGFHRVIASAGGREPNPYHVTMLNPKDFSLPTAAGSNGTGSGSAPQGIGATGGGGGQQLPKPASKGPAPMMAPEPQIVRANPSDIPNPALPVPPTLLSQNVGEPPPPAPLGDPKGKPGDFSPGPGTGGGLGTGKGTGVGSGNGPGLGKGSSGGTGGGPGGDSNGRPNLGGVYDFRLIPKDSSFHRFTWIYRARPVITPEAIENKVEGNVWLRATFRADGTITDISVIQGVDYMTDSAIYALKHSRFRPAMLKGVPITLTNVPVQIEITVRDLSH